MEKKQRVFYGNQNRDGKQNEGGKSEEVGLLGPGQSTLKGGS